MKREAKRLAAEGLSRREIAERIGMTLGAVSVMLSRLRVRTYGKPGPRPGTKAGGRNNEAYRMVHQIKAAKMGWPQAETITEARLLDAIHKAGEATIQAALGRKPDNREKRALARLARAGLVVRRKLKGKQLICRLADGLKPGNPFYETQSLSS